MCVCVCEWVGEWVSEWVMSEVLDGMLDDTKDVCASDDIEDVCASEWVCVSVCVWHIGTDVKLLLLYIYLYGGVTGVPGGSVTNEDTSPGPV